MSAQSETLLDALSRIAVGRTDCGRPLGGETARQIARIALIESGLKWQAPKPPVQS